MSLNKGQIFPSNLLILYFYWSNNTHKKNIVKSPAFNIAFWQDRIVCFHGKTRRHFHAGVIFEWTKRNIMYATDRFKRWFWQKCVFHFTIPFHISPSALQNIMRTTSFVSSKINCFWLLKMRLNVLKYSEKIYSGAIWKIVVLVMVKHLSSEVYLPSWVHERRINWFLEPSGTFEVRCKLNIWF